MKTTLKTLMLLNLFFLITLTSCNNEELFVEPVSDIVDDTSDEDTDNNSNSQLPPCNFTLNNVAANSTIIIDCILDLQGQTINLPSSVTLLYEGGDIINGTINFSDNSIISGELLNSTITIGGYKPVLKDPTFTFDPKRWGIVEGETTSDIALNNRNVLESIINKVKELGVNTFKIDKMDAYFEVSKVTSTTTNQNFYPSIEAINIPSNFSLIMTENTTLRVQPNGVKDYTLLGIREVSNVKIFGGNLYGDRFRHNDSQQIGNSGHVLMIHGSHNIEVNGVRMVDGTGDGLNINSIGFTFEQGYTPSNNIKITNCILDNNRRNNMSITDGFNILIDNNLFLNAGIDHPNSSGVAPGFALDVEAVRGKDESGNYIFYEKAFDITISNNTERGSKYGSFIVAVGENTTIENNTTEKFISIADASGVKIIGNTITAPTPSFTGAGIITGHPESNSVYNNVISGNTIKNYNIGIAAYQRDTEIFDNTLIDFSVGIQPKDIENINIYRNSFDSNINTSVAIFGNITSMKNVNIYENNIINVGREAIKMVMVNANVGEEENRVNINNNSMMGKPVTISMSKGFNYTGNQSEHLTITLSEAVTISNNTINSSTDNGIDILNSSNNIQAVDNIISVTATNKVCIFQSSDVFNITTTNNQCAN